ncbi:MAG: hypothetical protein Q9227_007308, partial [Pyrenula ochraceoflavens]
LNSNINVALASVSSAVPNRETEKASPKEGKSRSEAPSLRYARKGTQGIVTVIVRNEKFNDFHLLAMFRIIHATSLQGLCLNFGLCSLPHAKARANNILGM